MSQHILASKKLLDLVQLGFLSSSVSNSGVTATVVSTDSTQKFSFRALDVTSGVTRQMIIKIGGVTKITVDFPTNYIGVNYVYVSSNGPYYTGKFKAGVVNFTENEYVENALIPITPENIYYNSNIVYDPNLPGQGEATNAARLVDGDTAQADWFPNSLFLNRGDYGGRLTVMLHPVWQAKVDKVKIWSDQSAPFTPASEVYVTVKSTGQNILIGTFDGHTTELTVSLPGEEITRVYIEPKAGNPVGYGKYYGNQIDIIGSYKNLPLNPSPRPKSVLGKMMGCNSFWWFLFGGDSNGVPLTAQQAHPDKVAQWDRANMKYHRLVLATYMNEHSGVAQLPGTKTGALTSEDDWATYTYNPATGLVTQTFKSNGSTLQFTPDAPGFLDPVDANEIAAPELFETRAFEPMWNGWCHDSYMDLLHTKGWALETHLQLNHPRNWETFKGQGASYPGEDLTNQWVRNSVNQWTFFKHGDQNNRLNPFTYRWSARLAYIHAARYGANAGMPDAALGMYGIKQSWEGTPNYVKKGLNKFNLPGSSLGFGNESDRTWGQQYGYMDGWKMAAFMSAYYDGHKGTIKCRPVNGGKDIEWYDPNNSEHVTNVSQFYAMGIKNADPSIPVVTIGQAMSTSNGMKGVYDWCRIYRGYKEDGSVDLPFDVVDIHHYQGNSADGQHGYTTQGLPPEYEPVPNSSIIHRTKEVVDFSNNWLNGRPVTMSEWGYDWNNKCTFSSMPVARGNGTVYTRKQTVGIWSIRTMLMMLEAGLDIAYFFTAIRSNQATFPFNQIFETMEVFYWAQLPDNTQKYFPRPIADYFAQIKDYEGYTSAGYVSTNPYVLKLTKAGSPDLYFVWQKESSTPGKEWRYQMSQFTEKHDDVLLFTEQTGTYNLAIPNGTRINIKNFVTGGEKLSATQVVTSGATHAIPYGSLPTIVEVGVPVQTFQNPPIVYAGGDKEIYLPTNSVSITPTITPQGGATITNVKWLVSYRHQHAQTGARGTITLSADNTPNITVSNLSAGWFELRLEVTDSNGNTAADIVDIHVKQLPVANAGPDQTLSSGVTSTSLTAAGSHDTDGVGYIHAYTWSQVSGPNTATITPTGFPGGVTADVTGLITGTYVFQLVVEDDDHDLSAPDTVTIIVN